MERTFILGCALFLLASPLSAETWNVASGSASWALNTNWFPQTVPNATGATANFNNAATTDTVAQTGNRTITLDGATTVGAINFNADAANAFTNSITTGSGGPLTFDAVGTGPATITTNGPGTGNNTISVAMVLTDDLLATVNQQNTASAALSLNLTAAISGAGGFTKTGDGGGTFGTGAKTYTGPTNINGGRMRISQAARPQNTSLFTINAGGQVDPITAGTYTFGPNAIHLNGSGPAHGQFSAFPGAIRPDRGLAITITNDVVLDSATLVHMQANNGTGSTSSPVGSLTFSGAISGIGSLNLTAPNTDIDNGNYILTGANSYSGGTLLRGGILDLQGVGTVGTGNVTIDNATSPSSIARLHIETGVSNGIADNATLSLAGGNSGFAILDSSVNETVGGLVLGGVAQTTPGTYGSTSSSATFQNDTFFQGAGMITLAPAAGLGGDYNNDGKVDAADYVLWRKNPGAHGGDPAGYITWRNNFGLPGSGTGLSSSAVPEPAAVILVGLALSSLTLGRHSRNNRQTR